MMRVLIVILALLFGFVKAFLDEGFDPNAINGFGTGPFDPNAGYSTIAPPAIGGGGYTGGSGFNPNGGQATTIPPPDPNGFTGWSGSGNFNPNSGYKPTTSAPAGGNGFGTWSWGGAGTRKAATTKSPFGNFGNDYWGFGGGSGGWGPNTAAPSKTPSTTTTTTTTTTTHAPTSTFPTIHPTTVNPKNIFGGVKSTPLSYVGKKATKSKRYVKPRILIGKLLPARGTADIRNHIVG